MQISYLHKNIYKLYKYSKPQEFLEVHHQKYEDPVHKWERLKEQGVEEPVIASFAGISRATYYRYKRVLKKLIQGILPPTQRPKSLRKSKISQTTKDLVLKIRKENPTYGVIVN